MNIKILFPVVVFFSGFLLISCSDSNSKFISEVDKLGSTLLLAEQSIKVVDTGKIRQFLIKSNENLRFIQENYSDTMARETALLISDYSASRKSLRMFLENFSDVGREINYSKNQLFALKTDLENNLMEEGKFTDYFASESKSVEKLDDLSKNLLHWYETAIKMYEEKSPAVEKIIKEMKEKAGL